MMQYKATVSFSGTKLSMSKGKVREISDQALVDDLLKAGYIIPFVADAKKPEQKAQSVAEAEPKAEPKKTTRRKGKTS